MANIAFGSKYFIFSKFSSIPKTSRIEKERAKLIKELNELKEFGESEELKNFYELEQYLQSKEYTHLINKLRDQKKAEEDRIRIFEEQKKSKKFKGHFKFKASEALKNHLAFASSKELSDFEELKTLVNSAEFSNKKNKLTATLNNQQEKKKQLENLQKSKVVKSWLGQKKKEDGQKKPTEVVQYENLKNEIENPEFKASVASTSQELEKMQKQENEFKRLQKSASIKRYFKFGASQKYKNFQDFEKSKELADHITLKKYLESEEHAELIKHATEKLKEENEKKKAYEDFKNSKKFKWYSEVKDSNKFDELKKWKLVFEDDFKGDLDRDKWLTRYFWGDKLINDAYALQHDKAFPTDGKNIETGKDTLKIITRKEKTEGKVWNPPFGFMPAEFNYTTGLISSARSHQQQFGKIEAKIKINYAKPVNYNFWMASGKMVPHVDILKIQNKKSKVEVAHHYGDITDKKGIENSRGQFTGLDVAQDYFIYTLLWSKDKLTWKINDVVVHEQTRGIPQEPMYIVFSSGITGKVDGTSLPASMEIDWVRCYREG